MSTINLNNVNLDGYDTIPYPMVTEYSGQWDKRDIAREFISNAMDTHSTINVNVIDNTFIVSDSGPTGILPKNLLLGKHKDDGQDTIGQFGEGLKIGLLVCLKLGLKADILSHNFHYVLNKGRMIEEDILEIKYKDYGHQLYDGTQVRVYDWNDQNYLDLFILDNSIFDHSNNFGGIILNQAYSGKIFVKNVFVQFNPALHFGYNLNEITMVKGRSTIQDFEIYRNIGKVMATCSNRLLWADYFNSIHTDKMGEKLIDFPSYKFTEDVRQAILDGFKISFGNVLLGTSRNMMNQAKHLGRDTIFADIFGQDLINVLASIIGIDKDFVIEKLGQPFQVISSHKINDNQKITLKYIRKIADKLDFDRKKIKIAGNGCEFLGLCDYSKDTIFLKDTLLEDLARTIGVFIHEVAHYKTHAEDLTDEHVTMIEKLSGQVIASYMKHGI